MKIIVDSREQRPFTFTGNPKIRDVETISGTLTVGDYSLPGLADKVAVERKSLDDLIHCLCQDRERFERELMRARALDAFCVVVEASWEEIATGNYRSQMKPHAACQSIHAFMVRYGCQFTMAGSRTFAEYCAWSFLRQYLNGAINRWKTIARSQETEILEVLESKELAPC